MPSFQTALCGFLLSLMVSPRQFAGQNATGSPPAAALAKARGLYYTPVDSGLKSFHCDVGFDWKEFIQKASNQAVPDDDSRLKYLKTIQMSIDDDLHGGGELHWSAPAPAPEDAEASVGKIREGMQQVWSGFFQSWNSFATGDLVTLDARATTERTSDGYHVAVRTGPGLAEELYDSNLLLKTVRVTTPTLESIITPTFSPSAHGLLLTAVSSSYKQPPTAQPVEVTMKVGYATVGTFQLPSELSVSVGPANFDYHLVNCTVQTQLTQK